VLTFLTMVQVIRLRIGRAPPPGGGGPNPGRGSLSRPGAAPGTRGSEGVKADGLDLAGVRSADDQALGIPDGSASSRRAVMRAGGGIVHRVVMNALMSSAVRAGCSVTGECPAAGIISVEAFGSAR
jgi:hypothetical protein